MPHDRFFLDSPYKPGAHLTLRDLEFHHFTVMRIKENEVVELVNGRGQLATATVSQVAKKEAHLTIDTMVEEKPSTPPLILAQALTRPNRLDFILEKGTELGMTELWLFAGNFSEKKEFNRERATAITVAAMKQSGRLYLPQIEFFPSIEKCPLKDISAYFGDLSPTAPPLASVLKKNSPTALFIGPEKGFSEEEIAWLQQKATGVKLHQNILRTDTAAIASLAICSHLRLCN